MVRGTYKDAGLGSHEDWTTVYIRYSVGSPK